MNNRIVILDFGSQFTQLIGRRVRDLHVYSELLAWNAPKNEVITPDTKGIILSGGPQSIYAKGAPSIQDFILESDLPILGICYGMQALTAKLGGRVEPSIEHEYGLTPLTVTTPNSLLQENNFDVWMSHGDRITQLPPGWQVIARSPNSPVAAMADFTQKRFGLQFHPEVHHTRFGKEIISRFLFEICDCEPSWTPHEIIDRSIKLIREQVGDAEVLSALSGGVDSAVTTALIQRALGDHVTSVFVDTGFMRAGEAQQVESVFRPLLGEKLIVMKSAKRFFAHLEGVGDPEQKRKIIGETFIREFEEAAKQRGNFKYLAQGTIYPDVIESKGIGVNEAHRIKSHHNVGGLPEKLSFKLIEPLKFLFKDEVRAIGETLGLPHEMIWRQPFPGPGLAVRCLGEVTPERIEALRQADTIFIEELAAKDLLQLHEVDGQEAIGTSQAFAVLLPVHSVGVMGDQRTYAETIALRAVNTLDFMTADWSRLPLNLLARVSTRIVNEVPLVNRVVYDITSKPPATIEWE